MGPSQKITVENYIGDDGVIRAYPLEAGSDSLAESIGLYMEYLVNAEDEKAFQEQFDSLRKHFVVQKEGNLFVRWRLAEGTQVNALIDDLRIMGAMEAAGEKFSNKEYSDFASQLANSISRTQTANGYMHDFYDWDLEMPANRITLSYLISKDVISKKTRDILRKAEEQPVFFPEYYDLKKKTYVEGSEVHMVDQLLIALNRSKIGVRSAEFDKWLIDEWNKEHKLYGRYSRKKAAPIVDYESLAVYYYLNAYFQAIGKDELANEVFHYTEELATEEILNESHFFDFIHYQLMQQNQ